MPYGDDISEGLPYVLSNPAGSTVYTATGYSYDIAIAGLPFFISPLDDSPYRRVTAQYRKQQIDQSREPGEQTLTGWWLRSQSSFHLGAGIKFFEPIQEESLRFQYTESKGIDVWTRGQATLLNDTASFYTGTAPAQLVGLNDGTNDCILITDGADLKKITTGGTPSTYVQTGPASTILTVTTNGSQYFFINGTNVHRGNVSGATSDTEIYAAPATTRATIRYVKQRLIAAVGSSIYELNGNIPGSLTALPTALYTHPNANWVWSSIAEGPQAIYVSGYDPNGTSSSVFKIGLNPATANALGFPTLETPTVIIDMPNGERINDFDVYLGLYAVLATSLGFRVGIADAAGDVQYGPLLFKDAPCNAIAFRDNFAYLSSKVDGEAGLVRVDLSSVVVPNSLFFPWAWDLIATGTTTTANQVAFFGNSDRAAFTNGNNTWAESTNFVPSGYLRTGFIRYNTLEGKIFKLINARINTANGAFKMESITAEGSAFDIGTFAQGQTVPEVNVNYPIGAQEYLGFRFTLYRDSADATKGPLFTGYQVKSLPAIPRQRLIQYPVMCYDHEMDKFNNEVGYEGSAFDRMSQLEAVENIGDTIRIEDFRTGENYIGLIEEMDFINRTPTDKRFSGYGGMLLVTIRSV